MTKKETERIGSATSRYLSQRGAPAQGVILETEEDSQGNSPPKKKKDEAAIKIDDDYVDELKQSQSDDKSDLRFNQSIRIGSEGSGAKNLEMEKHKSAKVEKVKVSLLTPGDTSFGRKQKEGAARSAATDKMCRTTMCVCIMTTRQGLHITTQCDDAVKYGVVYVYVCTCCS